MKFLSFLTSQESFLEFNFDILETNTVNIFLLIALLAYVKKTSFDPNLETRQQEIIQSIENAQKDFLNALEYYSFCEKIFQQTFFWLQYWKTSYETEKKLIVRSKYILVKKIIQQSITATRSLIKNFEKKSFLSVQKYINYFVASKILRKFFTLTEKEQSKLIEVTISALGGAKK